MPDCDTASSDSAVHDAQDRGRAEIWALVGALLLRPAVPALRCLACVPELRSGDSVALASTWQRLVGVTQTLGPEAVEREHAELFFAVGHPPVDPYASRYVSGFLMDHTLVGLRAELRTLGQARQRNAAHTEDHLGALCESMRLLIAGTTTLPGQPRPVQQRFLATYLLPWASICLADMRQATGASFYAALSDFFQAFLNSECMVLELDVNHPPESHHAALAVPA